ncbi:glycosyltransferase family 4 protein [Thiolapillus sp.]
MIKVTALTSGQNVPSTRFRIRQHIDQLRNFNIDVVEHYPAISKDKPAPFSYVGSASALSLPFKMAFSATKLLATLPGILSSYRTDVTWLSRGILLGIPTLEAILKQPVILDVDDAIWLRNGHIARGSRYLASNTQAIIAGNSYIAEWYSQYSDNVHIVPTAVDTDRYRPSKISSSTKFTIGWIGTKHNLHYLKKLEPPLAKFFRENKNSILLIVSDEEPKFPNLDSINVQYVRWSKENEVRLIQNMDVGLMPLGDTSWNRGKCSYKMLQYMSCGKPVVVSPVGMNVEVLEKGNIGFSAINNEEWYSSLSELKQNKSLRMRMGINARNIVLSHYSSAVITPRIAEIIRGVVKA